MQDLLDVSTGTEFKINKDAFNIREALEEVINVYAIQASDKNIQIVSNCAPNILEELISDKRRMQ